MSVEAQAACDAFGGITNVIEFVQTRRFTDRALPELMTFLLAADATPMGNELWSSLQSRSVEQKRGQLEDELFADGHIVCIF